MQVRIFLTCWLVYAVHFATEFVREHYLVVSMVEDRSFDLTRYYGLHPDIFHNPPAAPHPGTHHGANPGISMIGALVYAPLRPAVERIVSRERATRGARDTMAVFRGETRPRRLAFYETTRRLGLDVRFGLVAMLTAVLCMAPLAAGSVVGVFRILVGARLEERAALWLALAYAFATPAFFRAAYLNQNLAIAVFSVGAFLLLWNPGGAIRLRESYRELLAGFLGGLCLLNDYSGGLSLAVLGAYATWKVWRDESSAAAVRAALRYTAGALPPILVLMFYQWQSFGNPFYPPQHWMPPIEGSDVGYQGVGGPSLKLLGLLLFDSRTGLLTCAPVLLAALATPFLVRKRPSFMPARELTVCYGLALAYLLFFSTVQYTALQWVSGSVRYLMPAVPFLFLAASVALLRLPKVISFGLVGVSFIITWSMTMVRSQVGVVEAVQRAFVGGLQLPALTTYSRMSAQYAPWLSGDASPIPVLLLTAVLLFAIWRLRRPWAPVLQQKAEEGAA
jgi:hypothetical protein